MPSAPAPAAPTRTRQFLELLPAALAIVLLAIALAFDGAFGVRHWAPLAVIVLVLLAFAPLRRLRGGPLVAVLAFAGFAAWTALSALWSSSPGGAVEGACRAFLYAGLLIVPLATVPDRAALRRLAALAAATLGGVVLVTFAAVWISREDLFLAGRLDEPIGYRNGTAALMIMAFWPMVCVAAGRFVPQAVRAGAFTTAALALAMAYMTQSRGTLIAFACGGAAVVLLGPDRVRRIWVALAAAAPVAVFSSSLLGPYDAFLDKTDVAAAVDDAVTVLGLIAVLAFAGMLVVAVLDRGLRGAPETRRALRTGAITLLALGALGGVAGGLASVGDPFSYLDDKVEEFKTLDTAAPAAGTSRLGSTGGQRYDLWRIGVDEFQRAPVAGAGEGGYAAAYYRDRATDRNLSDPHSLPIRVLAELGLVGLLLLAAFAVSSAVVLARAARAAPDRRWVAAAAGCAGAFFGQVTVDWLWLIPGLAGIAMLALGLALALATAPETADAPVRSPWPVLAARLALGVAALAVVALYLGDYETREARAAGERSASAQLDAARRAERFTPLALRPRLLQAGALEGLGRRDAARRELQDALRLEPESFVVMALLGDLELRAGNERPARAWYRRALEANPRDVGLQRLAGVTR